MGKKAVMVSGVACIILIACLVPPIVKHFRIEGLVKDLHSVDEEVQDQAINELSDYGAEIVSRLLIELKTLTEIESPKVWQFNLDKKQGPIRIYELGVLRTLLKIGEPSIPTLINHLSNDDLRTEVIAICVIVYFYTGSSKFISEGLNLTGFSFLKDAENKSFYSAAIHLEPFLLEIDSEIPNIIEGVSYIKKVNPCIVHILKSLIRLRTEKDLVGYSFLIKSKVLEESERIIPSKTVLSEAKAAINRLKERSRSSI